MHPAHFDPVSLRWFVAACEEGNIARAAEREAIVPSAVSKRIAALEREIGTPLMLRGRRGIVPTPAGEALLRQARDVLDVMARMRAELGEFAAGVQGSVRVLASASVLAERLPEDIAAFLARHPGVRVSVDERPSNEIVRLVREGAADIGVLWDAVDPAGLSVLPYRQDHLGVAMHRGHRLARRRRLRLADVLDDLSIGVAPAGLMDRMLRRQAALAGRELVYRIQVSSLDAACRIVSAGLGVAILPYESSAPHAAIRALVMVPLDEPWALRRFALLSRSPRQISTTTRALLGHLGAQAEAPRN